VISGHLADAIRLEDLPRGSPGRQRVKARIKAIPEDFEVEEVNNFEPTRDGPHIFLWVEKRDVAGGELLRRLASALGIRAADIGYAGTKDRRAVTRQWLSVPGECERALEAGVELDGIRVLQYTRHRKKLRLGHLAGNRFRILLRGADPASAGDLAETGRMLEVGGFPNFYGEQRFGRSGESLAMGLEMVEGGGRSRGRGPGRFERRMLVSAVQSALFNSYLKSRIEAGIAGTVLKGDVMTKTDTGGLFFVEDVEIEQARLDAGETRITGPMFGNRFMAAVDEAGELERGILDRSGISAQSFDAFKRLARGTRRVLFERPGDFSATPAPDGVTVSFYLPRGTYASVLLRDFVNQSED